LLFFTGSTKEVDYPSKDDTFFFNSPTHSLESTKLFGGTIFSSSAANASKIENIFKS